LWILEAGVVHKERPKEDAIYIAPVVIRTYHFKVLMVQRLCCVVEL